MDLALIGAGTCHPCQKLLTMTFSEPADTAFRPLEASIEMPERWKLEVD